MNSKLVDNRRIFKLNNIDLIKSDILYWMSRDIRIEDNWALIYATELANQFGTNLVVCFCLDINYPSANSRSFKFLIDGLKIIHKKFQKLKINFYLLEGYPPEQLIRFTQKFNIGTIVCDFDSLKIKRLWKQELIKNSKLSVIEVDAHNLVPCKFISQKQEYAAYTLRPKINKVINEFLTEFPDINISNSNFETIENDFNYQSKDSISHTHFIPGEEQSKELLKYFIKNRLSNYTEKSNNPGENFQSMLSPYIHFGMISSQRIALEVLNSEIDEESKKSFLEQLIVRKELSDNYCYYNENYDSSKGFPIWSIDTLNKHLTDKRDYLYGLDQLENADTHDIYWNAAQNEMLYTGKMHGYMRMYWAKKILEWTRNYDEAFEYAIYLNDKYELDGRDSNGFTGIAWAIGGVHDRPWQERKIFGKIRYMNAEGLKRKFDMEKYINNTIF